ncbi:hypothetical protein [Sodalinema gerasimenkoae]|uniref:hypothetical protein n=1 Tax=Sodalinema gerasimenkoae TaxID=2862348 RepID=UPI00135C0D6B|nr:hypothetical protein [Sodalinema gerasimenkoae]
MTTVDLTGVSYQESFATLGEGLPTGWAIYTGATKSDLGILNLFDPEPATWNELRGAFKNLASLNSGLEFGDAPAQQRAAGDRALGIRQSASFGDPGAAFVFSLTNTEGFEDFQLSLEAQMLSVQDRSTSWTIDYRVGEEGDFFSLGLYEDPEVWGITQLRTGVELLEFNDDINNQLEPVQIRVVALSESTGSGFRDTIAIDNFRLTYRPVEEIGDSQDNAPQIIAIQRPDDADKITNQETIIYEVRFSEPVKEVDVDDFTLTTTGTATADIASVSANSGTVIEVILEGVTGEGSLRLDVLPETANIVNLAGVPLSEGFVEGDRYIIELKSNEPESNEPESNEPEGNEPESNEPESNEPESNELFPNLIPEPSPDPEQDLNPDPELTPDPTPTPPPRRIINQLILGVGTYPETLIGGDGDDTIAAFDQDDVIFGEGGNNFLFGNKGNDRIYSGDGDDTLFGGQGNDRLIGGPRNTVLSGDLGRDTLTGGGGNNLFILRPDSDQDLITDFNIESDRLGLSHGLRLEDLRWIQEGDDTLIRLEDGRAIASLQQIQANQIQPSQFRILSPP